MDEHAIAGPNAARGEAGREALHPVDESAVSPDALLAVERRPDEKRTISARFAPPFEKRANVLTRERPRGRAKALHLDVPPTNAFGCGARHARADPFVAP